METTSTPVFYTPNNEEQFFRKKHTATVAFVVGVLVFLLPFAELRCNSMSIARNSGLGIAAGMQWKSSMDALQDQFKGLSKTETKKEDKKLAMKPNIFAIAALIVGIAGILISFSTYKQKSLVSMCAGILAAVLLIALMIQLRSAVNSELTSNSKGNDSLDIGMSKMIKLHFTIWYYISLISFLVAAFFGYKHYRIEMEDAIRAAHQFDFQRQTPPPVAEMDTNPTV